VRKHNGGIVLFFETLRLYQIKLNRCFLFHSLPLCFIFRNVAFISNKVETFLFTKQCVFTTAWRKLPKSRRIVLWNKAQRFGKIVKTQHFVASLNLRAFGLVRGFPRWGLTAGVGVVVTWTKPWADRRSWGRRGGAHTILRCHPQAPTPPSSQ